MNVGKILGTVGKVALTVGATVINPAAGVAVGGGLLGGEVGARVGDKAEKATGRDIGKLTGPLGALAVPVALLGLAKALGMDVGTLCDLLQQACALLGSLDATVLLGLAGGATAVTAFNVGNGVSKLKR